MSNEERLDWLCRLRSFLVSVGMPKEWRTNFNEALATTIDYEKVLADIKAELDSYAKHEVIAISYEEELGLRLALRIIDKHINGKER